jgi:hypothetical protein
MVAKLYNTSKDAPIGIVISDKKQKEALGLLLQYVFKKLSFILPQIV